VAYPLEKKQASRQRGTPGPASWLAFVGSKQASKQASRQAAEQNRAQQSKAKIIQRLFKQPIMV